MRLRAVPPTDRVWRALSYVALGRTPQAPTDRIKNDTRDTEKLTRLARAGELTYGRVPDSVHEAMRDLVCARYACRGDDTIFGKIAAKRRIV